MHMRRALTMLVGVTFALILAATLYLSAATASVFDKYQPGISDFLPAWHFRFSRDFDPLRIILIVVGIPLVATFAPQVRIGASEMARAFARVALTTSSIVLVGLVAIDWLEPCRSSPPL